MTRSDRKLLLLTGTRPEVIKCAMLIRALKDEPSFQLTHCHTNQHEELSGLFDFFSIKPDLALSLTQKKGRSLTQLQGEILVELDKSISGTYDGIIVQGDTTSALAGALFGFNKRIPVFHVEAGFRTASIHSPFPEELNRRIISLASTKHFAPSRSTYKNLRKEGISEERIVLVGNTGIDALEWTLKKTKDQPGGVKAESQQRIIVTLHRRENRKERIKAVVKACSILANEGYHICFCLHPNPSIRESVLSEINLHSAQFEIILDPIYPEFIQLMNSAHILITDSGGIQEEASHLGIPTLVTRNETERVEILNLNFIQLIPNSSEQIVKAARELASIQERKGQSLYGSGQASKKIVASLKKHYSS